MRVDDETANIHPRPQLRRTGWIDLCGPWAFRFDDENRGRRDRWFERADVFSAEIIVPYPPESRLSGVHDTGFHPVAWYRREFSLDEIDCRIETARSGEEPADDQNEDERPRPDSFAPAVATA